MKTTQQHQEQSPLCSFRLRIVASYIALFAGFAVSYYYRLPLALPVIIFIPYIIRHVIRPVFPRASGRVQILTLLGVILFGVVVFATESPTRDILLGVILLPAIAWGLYSDYLLFRTESDANRNA